MVAGLTIGRKKYAAVETEMRGIAERAGALGARLAHLVRADAMAYGAVSAAYKMPKEPADAAAARDRAIASALIGAAEVPLETARLCGEVVELAAAVAARGNTNAVSDAGVAALLADAACRGAAYNVRINVAALPDRAAGAPLAVEAQRIAGKTTRRVAQVVELVERAI
jgi:glutamate formiminotransferase/formiminotetrahydrofolate cyclodeaminase